MYQHLSSVCSSWLILYFTDTLYTQFSQCANDFFKFQYGKRTIGHNFDQKPRIFFVWIANSRFAKKGVFKAGLNSKLYVHWIISSIFPALSPDYYTHSSREQSLILDTTTLCQASLVFVNPPSVLFPIDCNFNLDGAVLGPNLVKVLCQIATYNFPVKVCTLQCQYFWEPARPNAIVLWEIIYPLA